MLFCALIFKNQFSKIFKEYLNDGEILKKVIFFALIIIGTVLISEGDVVSIKYFLYCT